jgi:hypothetical protein
MQPPSEIMYLKGTSIYDSVRKSIYESRIGKQVNLEFRVSG